MSKKVVLYTSSVAGNVFVNKNTTQIKTWLLAFKAPFTEVDCSTDDAARQVRQLTYLFRGSHSSARAPAI
jgi:hypothetical protein